MEFHLISATEARLRCVFFFSFRQTYQTINNKQFIGSSIIIKKSSKNSHEYTNLQESRQSTPESNRFTDTKYLQTKYINVFTYRVWNDMWLNVEIQLRILKCGLYETVMHINWWTILCSCCRCRCYFFLFYSISFVTISVSLIHMASF